MKKILSGVMATLVLSAAGAAFAADGAAIYKSKCQPCHGIDGKGSPMAPAFAGNDFIKSSANEQIADVILKGRKGPEKHYKQFPIDMPKQNLSAEEAAEIISHLKSLAAK